MTRTTHSSRRQFARTLAAAAGAPFAAGLALRPRADGPAPTATATPAPKPPSAAAGSLAEIVRLRHGKDLSDEELREVTKAIDRNLESGERMRKVALSNGDEPEFVFSARTR